MVQLEAINRGREDYTIDKGKTNTKYCGRGEGEWLLLHVVVACTFTPAKKLSEYISGPDIPNPSPPICMAHFTRKFGLNSGVQCSSIIRPRPPSISAFDKFTNLAPVISILLINHLVVYVYPSCKSLAWHSKVALLWTINWPKSFTFSVSWSVDLTYGVTVTSGYAKYKVNRYNANRTK